MDVKPRAPLPSDARTLPARYYTDPQHFRAEMERFFFGMWICAGRTGDVPRPGDYVLRDVAGESVLIVRGTDGTLRAFYNVCRHRGTRLCTSPEGSFPGTIQCQYHAWTYDLSGRLVGAPHMDDAAGFELEDNPLNAIHLDVWDGHMFLNLASDPPPLVSQLAELPEKFRSWRMAELQRAHRIIYDVKANWKLIIQNYNECLHCPNLHPALNRLSYYLSGENEPLHETYMGGRMDLRGGVQTFSMDGTRGPRACLPALDPADRTRVYFYAVFPNLLLSLHPDYMLTHTLWPQGPGRTINICEWHFHSDEMAKPDFKPDGAIEFWDVTNRQDWHVCELSQAGIGSRGYRPGRYSNREDLLYAFDRYIVEMFPERS